MTQPPRGMASGRFDKAADSLFREINDSLAFDYRLLKQDIVGSRASGSGPAHAIAVLAAESENRG